MLKFLFLLTALPLHAVPQSAELGSTDWLAQETRRLLSGCRIRADNGTMLYTPDGQGHYRALWTRDFAYMVENAGNLMPQTEVEACLRFLIKGIRADGAAPDRVRPDGVPVYCAGPEEHPLGEPNLDNAQFLAMATDAYLKTLPLKRAQSLFQVWGPRLDRAMDWIPRAPSGLVWNDPAKPHSPYGFTDTVGKTGELFFESLLYWVACRRLAYWHSSQGNAARRDEYRQRSTAIEDHLVTLWDDQAGAFFAASKDCRQLDIWGNAYAIWIDIPLDRRRKKVLQFLSDHYDRSVWHGQVRHLLQPEHWQRLLTPVAPERYQNGAYWATASGWMIFALAQNDRAQAKAMWNELLADFRAGGICECINQGYRQLPDYVVSAANPLVVARRLRF